MSIFWAVHLEGNFRCSVSDPCVGQRKCSPSLLVLLKGTGPEETWGAVALIIENVQFLLS